MNLSSSSNPFETDSLTIDENYSAKSSHRHFKEDKHAKKTTTDYIIMCKQTLESFFSSDFAEQFKNKYNAIGSDRVTCDRFSLCCVFHFCCNSIDTFFYSTIFEEYFVLRLLYHVNVPNNSYRLN
eukprot:TRINITY_DN5281_c0_g1_i4.p1 TRINITY_DN5281_c0_g1~~TRINITY_DN5281_c0_g1_i4.p1  ORF type:complete len:125 (+),score=1.64 TRINITY_DN5281_c0_g1_i4:116-490(+)